MPDTTSALRTALILQLVLAGVALPAHALRVLTVTGSASARANGESSSGSFAGVHPEAQEHLLGVREGPEDFAAATVLFGLPGNGFEMSASADIARPFSGGLAGAGVEVTFLLETTTPFTATRQATATGSGFTGYSAYTRLYDDDGLIWDWNSEFGGSDACNWSHPNAADLCFATELPPGRYRVEVSTFAYWPPDCGSCHGSTSYGSAYVRMAFSGACSDTDVDGVCFDDDNCLSLWNPDQRDGDGNGLGDRCDPTDGRLNLSLPQTDVVEWDAEGAAPAWDFYRGDLDTLIAGGPYTQGPDSQPAADRVCGTPERERVDIREPAPGAVDFYLVGPAGGGIGADGAGQPRPLDDACPGS